MRFILCLIGGKMMSVSCWPVPLLNHFHWATDWNLTSNSNSNVFLMSILPKCSLICLISSNTLLTALQATVEFEEWILYSGVHHKEGFFANVFLPVMTAATNHVPLPSGSTSDWRLNHARLFWTLDCTCCIWASRLNAHIWYSTDKDAAILGWSATTDGS